MFWPPIDPNAPYAKNWQEYKQRYLFVFLAWLSFCPVMSLAMLVQWLMPQWKRVWLLGYQFDLQLIAFSAAGLVFISLGIHARNFPCPRCHKRFAGAYDRNHPFLDKYCYYCDLAMWWVTDDDRNGDKKRLQRYNAFKDNGLMGWAMTIRKQAKENTKNRKEPETSAKLKIPEVPPPRKSRPGSQ